MGLGAGGVGVLGSLGAVRAVRGGGAACLGYWRAAAPAADFAGLEAAEPIATVRGWDVVRFEAFCGGGRGKIAEVALAFELCQVTSKQPVGVNKHLIWLSITFYMDMFNQTRDRIIDCDIFEVNQQLDEVLTEAYMSSSCLEIPELHNI